MPVKLRDGFYGHSGPIDRIRQIYPDAWAWSTDGAKTCSKDYVLTGWTGIVPESCRNGTIVIPTNYQGLYWGWPNRLHQADGQGRGPRDRRRPVRRGLGDGPHAARSSSATCPIRFKGYIWVEDIWTVGPALRAGRDIRNQAQRDAAEAGLKRRRKGLH